jgi:hypothetical protein
VEIFCSALLQRKLLGVGNAEAFATDRGDLRLVFETALRGWLGHPGSQSGGGHDAKLGGQRQDVDQQLTQIAFGSHRDRHCERSEAIQRNVGRSTISGLLRRCAPRNDDSVRTQCAPTLKEPAYSCRKTESMLLIFLLARRPAIPSDGEKE